jgi:hypothetical protein
MLIITDIKYVITISNIIDITIIDVSMFLIFNC